MAHSRNHHHLFGCARCFWSGVRFCSLARCPKCGHPVEVLERRVPRPDQEAELAALREIVKSLAERCYVQFERLTRLAERKGVRK